MKVLKSPAVLILVGAVAGIIFGLVVGEWAANLKFVGDIFIRLIQMSIVPLVASSVIVATGAMTGAGAGRLAGATFGWMLGFAVVAAFVGWGSPSCSSRARGCAMTASSTRPLPTRPRRPRSAGSRP